MPQYDLSNIDAISAAAEQARARAGQEPNQDGYNAAWLHGYAQALADAAEQMETQQTLTHPDDKSGREIRFVDSENHTLFTLPDGANIVLTELDGTRSTLRCRYLDDTHTLIGGTTYPIYQFALVQEQRGTVYMPEQPRAADICDTYEVYHIKDLKGIPFGFSAHTKRDKLRPSDYVKVYAGVLTPETTLDDIYAKHNQDLRPRRTEIRAMCVGDIVVLTRGGSRRAFYVDIVDFREVKEFLQPGQTRKPRKKTGRGGECR